MIRGWSAWDWESAWIYAVDLSRRDTDISENLWFRCAK
jgi:hypothetical protein